MYQVGDHNIPLCLDCYFKLTQIQQRDLESNERMLNYLSDEIASQVGMSSMGPRFPPRPQPVHIGGIKLNNISVNNSVVGTINTGSIGSVDQSISALVQLGEPALAEAIKSLSEAILQSAELTRNQRNELVEIMSVLAREAATPKEARRSTVAQTLLDKAMKITSLANDITDVCQKWWPVLVAAIGVAIGGYKQAHGDCNVSKHSRDNPKLGTWCSTQRERYNGNKLSLDRVTRLEQLGFVWDRHEVTWEEMFAELTAYKQTHGDCYLPWRWKDNPKLANWCGRQRNTHKNKKLSPDRINRLEKLGFLFVVHESKKK